MSASVINDISDVSNDGGRGNVGGGVDANALQPD
jgi:hypothetical protein